MVRPTTAQLIREIKQIIDDITELKMLTKYTDYKTHVLAEKQFLVTNYSHLISANPELNALFDSCFNTFASNDFGYFTVNTKQFEKHILSIQTLMLVLVPANDEHNIYYITETIRCILEHDTQYKISLIEMLELSKSFNEKMILLMELDPVRFWSLTNERFTDPHTSGCLCITNQTDYKFINHPNVIKSYYSENTNYWIMENSNGHRIVVILSFHKLTYDCVDKDGILEETHLL